MFLYTNVCVSWPHSLADMSGQLSSSDQNNMSRQNVSSQGGIMLPALSQTSITQNQSSFSQGGKMSISKIVESQNEDETVNPINQSGTATMELKNEELTVLVPPTSVKWGLDRKEDDGKYDEGNTLKMNGPEQPVSGKQSSSSTGPHNSDLNGSVKILSEPVDSPVIAITSTPPDATTDLLLSPDLLLTSSTAWQISENVTNWWQEEEDKKKEEDRDKQQPQQPPAQQSSPPQGQGKGQEEKTEVVHDKQQPQQPSPQQQSSPPQGPGPGQDQDEKTEEDHDKQQPQQPPPQQQAPPQGPGPGQDQEQKTEEGQDKPQPQQPPPQQQAPPQGTGQDQEQQSPRQQSSPPPTLQEHQESVTQQPQPTLTPTPKSKAKMKKTEFEKMSNNLIIHMIEWSRANPDAVGYPLPGMAYRVTVPN